MTPVWGSIQPGSLHTVTHMVLTWMACHLIVCVCVFALCTHAHLIVVLYILCVRAAPPQGPRAAPSRAPRAAPPRAPEQPFPGSSCTRLAFPPPGVSGPPVNKAFSLHMERSFVVLMCRVDRHPSPPGRCLFLPAMTRSTAAARKSAPSETDRSQRAGVDFRLFVI